MLTLNFNSHAHVERDVDCRQWAVQQWISTHTLTWSVTAELCYMAAVLSISTHTLTWSVTFYRGLEITHNLISTHTLTWSVTVYVFEGRLDVHISTHTLTWSVTGLLCGSVLCKIHFNSHAHVERDF